jgi:flagellar FliL protein
MMSGSDDEADLDESAGIEQAEKESGKKESSHGSEKKPRRKKKPQKSGHGGEEEGSLVYAIQDIVVNPAGTAGSRFLSISFGFDVGSDALWADFEAREQMVRDALITILSSKTVSQLTDAKQKEIMRYQIKKRLSKLLETEELEAVYYTDFVLQ